MRALKFYQTGSLDDLRIEEVPQPTPGPGEVLVQVKAAAVNPSDIKNVQGKMHETTVPRIPGRDFAGTIVKGPADVLGQSVFGSGGNLGFGRDGSHAEFVAIPATAVIPLPRNLSFEQAAGIGVAYITAWAALVNAARIQSGGNGTHPRNDRCRGRCRSPHCPSVGRSCDRHRQKAVGYSGAWNSPG